MKLMRGFCCSLALAAFVACLTLDAQQSEQASSEMVSHDVPATFRSKVNLVMVPVVVRDSQGRAVGNLKREDFQLFDKGKLQEITKFSVEKAGAKPPQIEDASKLEEHPTGETAPAIPAPVMVE